MRETNKEDLKQAYKSEKDSRIKIRIFAVHMVRMHKKSIDETAADFMQSERWIHNWLRRYDEGGLDNFRDLLRPGKPRAVPQEAIDRIIDEMIPAGCTSTALQGCIHREAGRKLHITYIRKMMRNRGLSLKRALVDFSDQITKIYHQGAKAAQLTFEQPCGGRHTFEHRDEMRRD